MAPLSICSKKTASILAGAAVLALTLGLAAWLTPAQAAPIMASALNAHASAVESVGYYRYRRRHYPPVLPYYYNPGRPGGWSSYFGFVPYARGNYEIQALQRQFPEANYPPSMRYWNPKEFPPVGD
jgi:hypothetical protein